MASLVVNGPGWEQPLAHCPPTHLTMQFEFQAPFAPALGPALPSPGRGGEAAPWTPEPQMGAGGGPGPLLWDLCFVFNHNGCVLNHFIFVIYNIYIYNLKTQPPGLLPAPHTARASDLPYPSVI